MSFFYQYFDEEFRMEIDNSIFIERKIDAFRKFL